MTQNDEDGITLVQGLCPENGLVHARGFIPRGMVRKVRKLKG